MINKLNPPHQPIMKDEVVSRLVTDKSGIYLDCTLGFGGHSSEILKTINDNGVVIGLDCDPDAYKYSKKRFEKDRRRIKVFKSNYIDYQKVLNRNKIQEIDGVLLDLGISSFQIDHPGRGFSYRFKAPLDMRFDLQNSQTAYSLLNEYSEKKIAFLIKEFGEEKKYNKIAKSIVRYSKRGAMKTTYDLRDAVNQCLSYRENQNKVLSRVFQAIRIEVNKEFYNIKKMLSEIPKVIKIGGKIVLITFHSLEDRLVKRTLLSMNEKCIKTIYGKKIFRLDSKKVVKPSRNEILKNKRSRSAKLRSGAIVSV